MATNPTNEDRQRNQIINDDNNRVNRDISQTYMQLSQQFPASDARQTVLQQVWQSAGEAIYSNNGVFTNPNQPALLGKANIARNWDDDAKVQNAFNAFAESVANADHRDPDAVQKAADIFHLTLESQKLATQDLTARLNDGRYTNSAVGSEITRDDNKAIFDIGTTMLDTMGKKAGRHSDVVEQAMQTAAAAIKAEDGHTLLGTQTSAAANRILDKEVLDAFRQFAKEVKDVRPSDHERAEATLDKFKASLEGLGHSGGRGA